MDELATEMGERLKYPRFFVTENHSAPQNRRHLCSPSHSLAEIPHSPTGSRSFYICLRTPFPLILTRLECDANISVHNFVTL
jgi:hypothetical protein